MKKKAIQAEVQRMLEMGLAKAQVLRHLVASGAQPRAAAHAIASYPQPELLAKHAKLVDAMVVISWLQLAFTVLICLVIGLRYGLLPTAIITALVGAFGYLFVWGFNHNRAWAYNATLIMGIVNLPQQMGGLLTDPASSAIGLTLSAALMGFAWFVRTRIFPDFAFISPRKANGEYVFTA
ncbi:MAG: hypothetical protein RI907_2689 [Pseudomonadota bacterium]|jgi:hypothetical protein